MLLEEANAKINVFLDVVSKRENGYHNIVSIMQTVSLCDRVTVDFTPAKQTSVFLDASGNDEMPRDEKNLAYRAAIRFLETCGITGHVTVYIEKHIPMAAGLAGGSADAAAVLRALNTLCDSPLSSEELGALGVTLGADVPFCIRKGSAYVTGIGDMISNAPLMPSVPIVVACQGNGISTPAAYGELDEKYAHFRNKREVPFDSESILSAFKAKDIAHAIGHFYNIFEDVVPMHQPYVEVLKSEMYRQGAIKAMMSGSGPSVFGVFSSEEQATAAQKRLIELGAAAHVVYPST